MTKDHLGKKRKMDMKILKSYLFILLLVGFLYILFYSCMSEKTTGMQSMSKLPDYTCEICMDVSDKSMVLYAEK